MSASASALRDRRLRALGVEPLRRRGRAPQPDPGARSTIAGAPAPASGGVAPAIRRLALCPDPTELHDPALKKMYTALTEAVATAGLQPVRVCDVATDPTAAVMVFGAAAPPAGVPAARVLQVDALAVLHVDRGCKRRLWQRMQALGRGGSG
ncbi:MAG TPA: hypothetical protein VF292_09900 [Rhodanobacteraceae bacterium]